jgi:hypothetical protein
MPLFGTVKFGASGVKFGNAFAQFQNSQPGGMTSGQAAAWQTFAGASSAFPAIQPAVRIRCADICTFDMTTWTPGDVLPGIAPGAVRSASLSGASWEQQFLKFTVADLAYYRSGAGAGLLQTDSPVCVVWTVSIPGVAAQTYHSPPFRLITEPQPTWDVTSGTWQGRVEAVDFAQPVFAAKSLASNARWLDHHGTFGFGPQPFADLVDEYVAAGAISPVSVLQASFVAVVWATLNAFYGGDNLRFFVAEAWPALSNPADALTFIFGPDGGFILSWGSAGTITSPYDEFNVFSTLLGAFRQTFDESGRLMLRGWTPRDSGWFITCNSVPVGAQPLPWRLPIVRSIRPPSYGLVKYARINSPDPEGTIGGSLIDRVVDNAEVKSWARDNPFRVSVSSVESIVDHDTNQNVAGYGSSADFCRERLRSYLGAADTLNIAVDASVPPPQLGTAIRVNLPPDVDGIYVVTGWSQPLAGGASSLQAQWWDDA